MLPGSPASEGLLLRGCWPDAQVADARPLLARRTQSTPAFSTKGVNEADVRQLAQQLTYFFNKTLGVLLLQLLRPALLSVCCCCASWLTKERTCSPWQPVDIRGEGVPHRPGEGPQRS